MSEALLEWLTHTSLQVALLIAVVWSLQLLLRRWLTPRWQHALWLVVLLRLALPVVPSVPMGGLDERLVAMWSQESVPAPVEIAEGGTPEVVVVPMRSDPADAKLADSRSSDRPKDRRSRVAGGASRTRDVPALVPAMPTLSSDRVRSPESIATPNATPSPAAVAIHDVDSTPEGGGSWGGALIIIWALVAAMLLIMTAVRTLRFGRMLRESRSIDGPADVLERCRAALGIRRAVRLREIDQIPAPAVTGLLRPTVLLPSGAASRLSDAELRHVFMHELAHVRHHDLAVSLASRVLQSLFWFHPLVWFAMNRLQHTQEAARDQIALERDSDSDPIHYARTLLKLCEGRIHAPAIGLWPNVRSSRDLRRRILMITHSRSNGRPASVLGTFAVAGLAWVGFTSAPVALRAEAPSSAAAMQDGLRRISVERHQPAPGWRLAVEAKLDMPVSFEANDTPVSEILAFMREVTEANIVVQRDVLDDIGDPEMTFKLVDTPLREVLNLICSRDYGLAYCVRDEAILIGEEGVTDAMELRFYRVTPLVKYRGDDGEMYDLGDQLIELIMLFASPRGEEVWEYENTSIDYWYWKELLVVSQTPDMHDRIEALLNRILNNGERPAVATPEWQKRLDQALATEVSVNFEDADLQELAQFVSDQHDVTVMVDEDWELEPFSLRLNEVSLARVLEWAGRQAGARVAQIGPTIRIGETRSDLELEFHDMSRLYGAVRQRAHDDDETYEEDLRNSVADTIRSRIDPEVWDEDGAHLVFWKDQLLVTGSSTAQQAIRDLLAALERAMG